MSNTRAQSLEDIGQTEATTVVEMKGNAALLGQLLYPADQFPYLTWKGHSGGVAEGHAGDP